MAFAHLTLATRDVFKTLAFFSKTLGWRAITKPSNIGRPAGWLEIAPGQELHLIEVSDFEPSSSEAEFGRHFAFTIPRTEFAGLKRRLTFHGAKLIDAERETPFARFFFQDPNGYVFEIIEEEQATPEQ